MGWSMKDFEGQWVMFMGQTASSSYQGIGASSLLNTRSVSSKDVIDMRIGSIVYGFYKAVMQFFLLPLLLIECQSFPALCRREANERAVEYAFVFRHLSQIYPANVLDVGAGQSALPALIAYCGFKTAATDEKKGYWKNLFVNHHYYVVSDDITKTRIKRTYDMITCISTLEHIANHNAAIGEMFKLLQSNGYLCLTFPYNENEYVQNVYDLPEAGRGKGASYICQVFSRKTIDGWIEENGGKVVDQEYWRCFTGPLWTLGDQIFPPQRVTEKELHQLSCVLIQKA